jgi:signal transduction histidine kinase
MPELAEDGSAQGRPAAPAGRIARPTPDDARRAFLRSLSHELRTPLNSIIGFSDIIAGELLGPIGSPSYREYAGMIRDSGHKLLEVINHMLELARLDGAPLDFDLGPEDLEGAVSDAVDMLGAGAARVTLKIETPGLRVRADPRALRTLFNHLLQNALRVSPPDADVTLRALTAGAFVEIEFIDQGPPMAPEAFGHLLRPFFHGAETMPGAGRGANWAIPVCARLCEVMGGSLTARAPQTGVLAIVARLPAA